MNRPGPGGELLRQLIMLRVLAGMELTRLMRTEQVHRFVLLPALLILPLTIMGATMVASFVSQDDVLAVPAQLPLELSLVELLEAEGWETRVVDDPRALFEAGEADAAIVAWREAEGLGRATGLETAWRARWQFDLLADDGGTGDELEGLLDQAGNDWLADVVGAAGGTPEDDVWVARVDVLRIKEDKGPPVDPTRMARAYAAFLLGTVAFFFSSLTGVADRQQGVTETFRVLPVSSALTLWARLLALLVVQAMAAVLLGGNVMLLFLALINRAGAPLPGVWEWCGLAGALVFCNALYAVIGVWAPSAKAANNGSSIVMMILMSGLTAGVLLDLPAWVPLAGAVSAEGALANVVAILSCVGVAVVVLALTGQQMQRRVSLVLPEGRE